MPWQATDACEEERSSSSSGVTSDGGCGTQAAAVVGTRKRRQALAEPHPKLDGSAERRRSPRWIDFEDKLRHAGRDLVSCRHRADPQERRASAGCAGVPLSASRTTTTGPDRQEVSPRPLDSGRASPACGPPSARPSRERSKTKRSTLRGGRACGRGGQARTWLPGAPRAAVQGAEGNHRPEVQDRVHRTRGCPRRRPRPSGPAVRARRTRSTVR